jgi:hypothetical protein
MMILEEELYAQLHENVRKMMIKQHLVYVQKIMMAMDAYVRCIFIHNNVYVKKLRIKSLV